MSSKTVALRKDPVRHNVKSSRWTEIKLVITCKKFVTVFRNSLNAKLILCHFSTNITNAPFKLGETWHMPDNLGEILSITKELFK